jgi:hypothetical protein
MSMTERQRRRPPSDEMTALVDAYQALAHHSTEVVSFIRSQQVNRILFSGLIVLDITGYWEPPTGFSVPFSAVKMYAHTAGTYYVTNDQSGLYAPNLLPPAGGAAYQGVQRVDGLTGRSFALTGVRLSISGPASGVVSLVVYSSQDSAESTAS